MANLINDEDENDEGRHHKPHSTIPFAHSTRQKPRRWPLALRFIKGAIHAAIMLPVTLHGLFAALVVFLNQHLDGRLGLPASIVFRNQTSYNRFWDGRNYLTVIITSVRNLTRSFLACSALTTNKTQNLAEQADTERVVRILIAILYATKNYLRAEWGQSILPGHTLNFDTGDAVHIPEYNELLPQGMIGLKDRGVGLPLQLTFFVEEYIKKSFDKGYFHGPQASQLSVQLFTLTDAYGRMETIRLTNIPIAHLIHQKQVLALFGCVLPFALVEDMGWWSVPIVVMIMFTVYGIDGIGNMLEDPFGCDRNGIKMGPIVEDIRSEIMALLDEWKRVNRHGGEMFMGKQRLNGGNFRDGV